MRWKFDSPKRHNWALRTYNWNVEIRAVRTAGELQQFIGLPYRIYRDDPIWVAPLRSGQHGEFDPRRNPLLDHCERQLFVRLQQRLGHPDQQRRRLAQRPVLHHGFIRHPM